MATMNRAIGVNALVSAATYIYPSNHMTIWKPHVVVAAIIERDGRFLMVEETTEDGVRYNQPAGHLEAHESLLDAVERETLEETAHHFVPEALLGIYRWRAAPLPGPLPPAGEGDVVSLRDSQPRTDRVYLRFAFTGRITGFDADLALDAGILRALWLTPAEIDALKPQHRSPLVAQCIADYQTGRRYSLELLKHYEDTHA